MKKRAIPAVFLALSVGACSPRDYVRSADSQVKGLLNERLDPTLGYHPDTRIDGAIPQKPEKIAFDRIPLTPIPPASMPALTPGWLDLPLGVLGPPWPPPPASSATTQLSNQESDTEPVRQQLLADSRLGPPSPKEPGLVFNLFQSLHYAVQNSREYKTNLESLYLAALDVTLQRHLFEPRPFAQTHMGVTGGVADPTTPNLNYQAALNATATAGVKQQLPYGGEVTARALVDFISALDGPVSSGESATVALTASIPLLRGFGMVNLEPLISSERNLIYQIRAFEEYRRQFVVSIASQYFRLVSSRRSLSIRRANYLSLVLLTERTEALYGAGRLNFLEVQRSLQAQLQAQSSMINSEQSYQSAVDQFKILLGMPIEKDLDIASVELSLKLPEASMDQAVALAMQYRLDLQTQRDKIDDSRRNVSVAENQLLPDLNFDAAAQWGNVSGTPASHLSQREFQYSAGVTLDLPVDRLSERNDYRSAIIRFHQAERRFQTLRDQISIDARDALRTIQSAERDLRIQKMGIDLAERRLDYSNELLKQGKVTARDVVESQSSLLSASDSYEQARAQLQISLLQYLQATGTLRIDPEAGALGRTMDRVAGQNVQSGDDKLVNSG